jgi:hypothetical protein
MIIVKICGVESVICFGLSVTFYIIELKIFNCTLKDQFVQFTQMNL